MSLVSLVVALVVVVILALIVSLLLGLLPVDARVKNVIWVVFAILILLWLLLALTGHGGEIRL